MAPLSRVLMDISEYNPYSKKYFLRKKVVNREKLPTETTKIMCEELNNMLKSFADLSQLTIDNNSPSSPKLLAPEKTTTRLEEPYKQIKDLHTITKYNFKKKKITIEPAPLNEREGDRLSSRSILQNGNLLCWLSVDQNNKS